MKKTIILYCLFLTCLFSNFAHAELIDITNKIIKFSCLTDGEELGWAKLNIFETPAKRTLSFNFKWACGTINDCIRSSNVKGVFFNTESQAYLIDLAANEGFNAGVTVYSKTNAGKIWFQEQNTSEGYTINVLRCSIQGNW